MRRNIVFAAATAAMLGAPGTVGACNEDQLTHPPPGRLCNTSSRLWMQGFFRS